MEKLKPCPFCGSTEGVFIETSINSSGKENGWDIGCWNIECMVQPEVWEETKKRVIAVWNKRDNPKECEKIT